MRTSGNSGEKEKGGRQGGKTREEVRLFTRSMHSFAAGTNGMLSVDIGPFIQLLIHHTSCSACLRALCCSADVSYRAPVMGTVEDSATQKELLCPPKTFLRSVDGRYDATKLYALGLTCRWVVDVLTVCRWTTPSTVRQCIIHHSQLFAGGSWLLLCGSDANHTQSLQGEKPVQQHVMCCVIAHDILD